jgi:hypothetical protein
MQRRLFCVKAEKASGRAMAKKRQPVGIDDQENCASIIFPSFSYVDKYDFFCIRNRIKKG